MAQGNSTVQSDFATAVQQIIALGFNTVKLPFSFPNLLTSAPDPVSQKCSESSDDAIKVRSCCSSRAGQ